MSRRFVFFFLIAIFFPARFSHAGGSGIRLDGEQIRIEIGTVGGLPIRWESCGGPCARDDVKRQLLLSEEAGGGRLQWFVPGDSQATERLRSLRYTAAVESTGRGQAVGVTAQDELDTRRLVHRYELSGNGHLLRLVLDVPAGAVVELLSGAAFVPEQLPGFGSLYGDVRIVWVDDSGQTALEFEDGARVEAKVQATRWAGIRNRFWTLLFKPESTLEAVAEMPTMNRPRLGLLPDPTGGRLALDIYGGPVEWGSLKAADPVLSEMLFAALWDFLRALCFGMLYLLNTIQGTVSSAGLAIILLSLAVKILMWPLTRVADGWQDDVNRTASLLQPQLDAIKEQYKGEEAHNLTLAVYKEHDVNPLYTFKSLAGFMIQIPVFIAAFDMLGENFGLYQAGFLWSDDLAKPDHWLALPFVLPFFGGHLNLLPFLMTGFTLWSSVAHTEVSLPPELMRRQRSRLYLMAAAFFVLFYTFPAGMVLYWTTNNVLHLFKVQLGRVVSRRKSGL